MKPTLLPIPLALVACSTLALGGCGAFENFGGNKKVSPDEFKIVSHSPLTMPPNAELRPPRPGEPRPQEVTPADQAKEALSPALAGRTQARVNAGPDAVRSGSTSEQALVAWRAESSRLWMQPTFSPKHASRSLPWRANTTSCRWPSFSTCRSASATSAIVRGPIATSVRTSSATSGANCIVRCADWAAKASGIFTCSSRRKKSMRL